MGTQVFFDTMSMTLSFHSALRTRNVRTRPAAQMPLSVRHRSLFQFVSAGSALLLVVATTTLILGSEPNSQSSFRAPTRRRLPPERQKIPTEHPEISPEQRRTERRKKHAERRKIQAELRKKLADGRKIVFPKQAIDSFPSEHSQAIGKVEIPQRATEFSITERVNPQNDKEALVRVIQFFGKNRRVGRANPRLERLAVRDGALRPGWTETRLPGGDDIIYEHKDHLGKADNWSKKRPGMPQFAVKRSKCNNCNRWLREENVDFHPYIEDCNKATFAGSETWKALAGAPMRKRSVEVDAPMRKRSSWNVTDAPTRKRSGWSITRNEGN